MTNPYKNLEKSIEKTHKGTHLNFNKARRSTLRQAGCGLIMLMMRMCLRASPEKILLWDCNRSGEGRGEEQWHTARWLLPRRPARPQWNYKNGPPQCLDGLTTSTGILSHVKSQSLKNLAATARESNKPRHCNGPTHSLSKNPPGLQFWREEKWNYEALSGYSLDKPQFQIILVLLLFQKFPGAGIHTKGIP